MNIETKQKKKVEHGHSRKSKFGPIVTIRPQVALHTRTTLHLYHTATVEGSRPCTECQCKLLQWCSIYRYEMLIVDISTLLKNIGKDIDKDNLENIDIDKAILENIDIAIDIDKVR